MESSLQTLSILSAFLLLHGAHDATTLSQKLLPPLQIKLKSAPQVHTILQNEPPQQIEHKEDTHRLLSLPEVNKGICALTQSNLTMHQLSSK